MTAQTATRVPGPSSDFEVAKPAPNAVPAVIEPKGNGAAPAPAVALPQTGVANIAGAIAAIMAEIQPIAKEGTHKHFHFKYAKMGDILTELTPLLGKHKLAIIPTEISKEWVGLKHVSVIFEFTIAHASGEVWPGQRWTGLSLATSERGSFDDKCLNKCAIAARKSFLQALFNIPTEEAQDPDAGHNDAPSRPSARAPVPSPNTAPVPTGPHEVPAAGQSYASWARAFLNEVTNVIDPQVAAQWVQHNAVSLRKLNSGAPDIYTKLMSTIPPIVYEAVVAAFRPAPKPSDQGEQVIWDETEERPATAEDHDPQTGEVCPAYATDPEAHFQFVSTRLRAATTRDGLNDIWARHVEPVSDALFPPDRSALSGVMKVCWNKLEGASD